MPRAWDSSAATVHNTDSTSRVVFPIGNGNDDWPALFRALTEMAYIGKVVMAAGTWYAKSDQVIPSGSWLVMNPGVTIVSSLSAAEPAFVGSVFYNVGSRPATTTLSADVAAGAFSVTVADASAISVGDTILLQHGAAWWHQRDVLGKSSNTLTLDAALPRPYSSADTVSKITPARDIRIEGNNAMITGTGGAIVEITCARDCHISGIIADVSVTGTFAWDVGSRGCTFERCISYGNGTTHEGQLLTQCEDCHVIQCKSFNSSAYSVFVTSCDACTIRGGFFSGSGGSGLHFAPEDVSDTIGCQDCAVIGATVTGATTNGIFVSTASRGLTFADCTSSFNNCGLNLSGAAAKNCTFIGGTIRGNAQSAVVNAGGVGNRVVGAVISQHTTQTVSCTSGEIEVADCTFEDTAVASAGTALMYAVGATAQLRSNNNRALTTRTAQHMHAVATGGKMWIDGGRYESSGSTNNYAVLVGQGTVRVDHLVTVLGTGSIGVDVANASGHCRMGSGNDFSGAATQFNVASGDINRGTFTLNGTTPVSVAFGDTNAKDRLFYSLKTSGGTPTGIVFVGAPSVGTGFSVSGVAGDTSTYEYEIR